MSVILSPFVIFKQGYTCSFRGHRRPRQVVAHWWPRLILPRTVVSTGGPSWPLGAGGRVPRWSSGQPRPKVSWPARGTVSRNCSCSWLRCHSTGRKTVMIFNLLKTKYQNLQTRNFPSLNVQTNAQTFTGRREILFFFKYSVVFYCPKRKRRKNCKHENGLKKNLLIGKRKNWKKSWDFRH